MVYASAQHHFTHRIIIDKDNQTKLDDDGLKWAISKDAANRSSSKSSQWEVDPHMY